MPGSGNTQFNVIKEDRRGNNDDKREITQRDLEELADLVADILSERAQVKIRLIRSIVAWIVRTVGVVGTALALWHHQAIKVSLFG